MKSRLTVYIVLMLCIALFLSPVQRRLPVVKTQFKVKKIIPDKAVIQRGGKGILIKLTGQKLLRIKSAAVLKIQGKKFLKSKVSATIVKKGSRNNRLLLKLMAAKNASLGKNYILRLFEKKVKKITPYRDVPSKLLKIKVVSRIKTKGVEGVGVGGNQSIVSQSPDMKIYSLSKRKLQIKNDGKTSIIIVTGKNLNKVTSAQLILNNRVVKNLKVFLGRKKSNSLEIKFSAPPLAKTGKNLKLRLLAGKQIIDIPTSRFTFQVAASKPKTPAVTKSTTKTGKVKISRNPKIKAVQTLPSLKSPDLRIEYVTVTPMTLTYRTCGDEKRYYTFEAKAINAGNFPAYIHGNSIIQVWLDEKSMAPLDTDYNAGYMVNMKPNETLKVKYTGSFNPGTNHSFIFITDKFEKLDESNEDNNRKIVNLNVPDFSSTERGDLIISDAHLQYTQNNKLIYMKVTVKNIGQNPVTLCRYNEIWTTFRYPYPYRWTGRSPSTKDLVLNPGDTYIFVPKSTEYFDMPAGEYNFTLRVDSRSIYSETNETNNTFQFTAKVPDDVKKSRINTSNIKKIID